MTPDTSMGHDSEVLQTFSNIVLKYFYGTVFFSVACFVPDNCWLVGEEGVVARQKEGDQEGKPGHSDSCAI